jgi:hypothetical protein
MTGGRSKRPHGTTMMPQRSRFGRVLFNGVTSVLALIALAAVSAHACSIVLLTDGKGVLFCNNEDWSNPNTRIWFVPGADGRHGCAYVGFDDGWGQGGLNTKGLAFDWVAGFKEKWEPDVTRQTAQGNPAQRMLETCSTVEEAIAFFEKYHEPSFSSGKMLVADPTGTSAVIGAKGGRLHIEKKKESRVLTLGPRVELVGKMLTREPEPSLVNAAKILRTALQEGKYATKYSNDAWPEVGPTVLVHDVACGWRQWGEAPAWGWVEAG